MRLIGYQEAALKLGLKVGTLYSWVCQGKGPPFVRLSARCVRFDDEALDSWLLERVHVPVDSASIPRGKTLTESHATSGVNR